MSISQNFPDEFPNLRLNFAQGKTLDPRVSFSRSSTATYIGPNGLIQTAGVNTPRFNYDPITGECKGLLMEESRANLYQYSNAFDNNSYWAKSGSTVTPNSTTSPDGTNNAYILTEDTSTGGHNIATVGTINVTNGLYYTVSIYCKPNGRTKLFWAGVSTYFGSGNVLKFDLSTLTVTPTLWTTGSIQILPNGWYRIIGTIPAILTGGGFFVLGLYNNSGVSSYTGDGTSGIYIYGAQLEQGSFPTSYIPTTNSTVTRSADVAQITTINLNNFYNSSGGTLLTIATPLSNTQNRTNLVTIGSATTNYPALISLLPGANGAQFRSTNSNILQADFAAVGSGTTRTIVCANFGNNNFTFNTNSNGLGTTSSGTIGTATTLTIGGTGYGTAETFNGTIENILYYPTPISNSQVTALSSASGSVQLANNQFAFTVRITTPGTTYTLLTNNSGSYNYNVNWGDGTVTNGITTNNPTKVYANAGVYTVIVTLNTGSFYFYNNNNATNGPLVTGVVGNGSSFGWNSNLTSAWYGCSNLTSFPLINTSNVTNFNGTWQNCSSLTSFPLIDTSKGTTFAYTWYNCSSLTSFPAINVSGTNSLNQTWNGCSLNSFPLIDTSTITSLSYTWASNPLTSFPQINTSNVTGFVGAWYGCNKLTSFPSIDTSKGTNFSYTWSGLGITSFPLLNTSSGTNFGSAWQNCSSLTSFPLLNLSNGTNFTQSWLNCSSLTSFPAITFGGAGATNPTFNSTWYNCNALSSFPANAFNACTGSTNYTQAFLNCALTSTSIQNILTSIVSSGATINTPVPGNIGLNGGTNASKSTWTTNANNAYNTLVGAGWTISYNP